MTVLASIQIAYKNVAWFNSNPSIVLANGQHVYLSDGDAEFSEAYVIGDGTTNLLNLPWKGLSMVFNREPFVAGSTSSPTVLSKTPVNLIGIFINGQMLTEGLTYNITSNTINYLTDDISGQPGMAVYESLN